MSSILCAACGSEMEYKEGMPPRICPYCGKTFAASSQPGSSDLEERLLKERNPKKKYQMIREVLDRAPDDFDANRALLFHGRLHEPMGKGIDFSIIKSHLLSVFHTPDRYTPEEIVGKTEELLRGEQLLRTMALAPDGDAFFKEYLDCLARDYISIFIRGDSKYSNVAFGFSRSADSMAKRCAEPVNQMIQQIQGSEWVDQPTRLLLAQSLRIGFSSVFFGYGHLLLV